MTQRSEYFRLHFVEFMEFFCRIADHHFPSECSHESDIEEESISPKVQRLLQLLLPLVGQKLDLGDYDELL